LTVAPGDDGLPPPATVVGHGSTATSAAITARPITMLTAVKLGDRLREIEDGLPPDWDSVVLRVTTEQACDLGRAAQVLGSLGAGRVGDQLVLTVQRAGQGSPESARRLFARLDEDRVWCEIEVVGVDTAEAGTEDPSARRSAAAGWDAAVGDLPADWSDALCELVLESSALLPRASLLCAPLNPAREREAVAFTFRAARRAGYGASAGMVRRCLERLDAEGIAAHVHVLRLLADTELVDTQGPVWRVGGRSL
jgi:hypothetical protein